MSAPFMENEERKQLDREGPVNRAQAQTVAEWQEEYRRAAAGWDDPRVFPAAWKTRRGKVRWRI